MALYFRLVSTAFRCCEDHLAGISTTVTAGGAEEAEYDDEYR